MGPFGWFAAGVVVGEESSRKDDGCGCCGCLIWLVIGAFLYWLFFV